MNDNPPVTWEALGTVLGASALALILVQAVKLFKDDLSDRTARQLALIFGIVVVEISVLALNDKIDWKVLVLGLLVGLQAGLAASKTYEVGTKGMTHLVRRR